MDREDEDVVKAKMIVFIFFFLIIIVMIKMSFIVFVIFISFIIIAIIIISLKKYITKESKIDQLNNLDSMINYLKQFNDFNLNKKIIIKKPIKCSGCGLRIEKDSKYCSFCGTKNDEINSILNLKIKFCQNCGEKLDKSTKVCSFCGMDIKNNLINFKSSKIPQYEVEILEKIEKDVGFNFTLVKEISKRDKMSFSVMNGKVKGICISNCKLKLFPESLSELKGLEKIILRCNNIKSIPESILNLKKLEILDLKDNLIINLPESLFNLKNLEKLNIKFNPINNHPNIYLIRLKEQGKFYVKLN